MNRTRTLALTVAVLLVGSTPASAAPARMADLGGFVAASTATPIKVDLFEQAIPIPASPQAELNFFYTNAEASTGPAAAGRASAVWPGDPIGEGFKTIADGVGLPAELSKDGYPLQTNAQSPGGPESASQEQFPGVVTRARSTPEETVAKAGYDPDGDVSEEGGQQEGAESGPDNPLSGASLGAQDPEPAESPLGALAAVVDAGAATSVSRASYTKDGVVSTATSTLNDVSLLAGLVTVKSIRVSASTESNLDGAVTTSKVQYAGLAIAGTPFEVTDEGVVAAGQAAPIPGLPSDPGAALAALGVTVEQPKPVRSVDGLRGSAQVHGLRVTIDTGVLQARLPALPIGDLVSQLPEEAGQLKGLLLALGEARPKIVVLLGNARTAATAVPPVTFGSPILPTPESPPTAGTPTTGGGATGGGGAVAGATVPPAAGAGGDTVSTPVTNVSSPPGLPPLGSIPGMLMLGGLLLGAGTGWWLRRGGAFLLGGVSNCAHGLKSGVPDLRKA